MSFSYKLSLRVRYEGLVYMFDMFNSERRFVWWRLEGVVHELGFGMLGGHGELHVWYSGFLWCHANVIGRLSQDLCGH